jgi:hypothetical protein
MPDSLSESDPPEPLVAGVLSAGILLSVIDREDAVVWADHLIEMSEQPPNWLIDLSLSQNLHVVDVMKLLDQIGKGADPAEVCRNLYGFLPSPEGYSLDQAEALARQAYRIAFHCFDADWSHRLLCEADHIDETFLLVRDGTFTLPKTRVIEELWDFLDVNRKFVVRKFLAGLRRHRPDDHPTSTP